MKNLYLKQKLPLHPLFIPSYENTRQTKLDLPQALKYEQGIETQGGVARGSCAHSFGVCCVFTSKCGEKSYQNGSYLTLDQNSFEKGSCSYQVCSTDPNVCKLRLDFESLVLTGKESSRNSDFKFILGIVRPSR